MTGKLIPALAAGLSLAVAGAGLAYAQMASSHDQMGHDQMGHDQMGHDSMAAGGMQRTVMVGGAPMYPTRTIVQNAANSKDHTTLVSAVKAAGLVETLSSPGPFTVFAPTNAAFAKLPAGTVETLVKPQNKPKLAQILTYHVVPGRLSAADLMARAKAGGGAAALKTTEGETLTVKARGGALWLVDAKGGTARVTIPNVTQSNGVIHVVDTVLMP